MPLKLALKPDEKVIVNGAVLTNGGSKTNLTVENSAVILREKDIMQEAEANTPAKRIYFCVQLAYLDDANSDTYLRRLNQLVKEFVSAVPSEEVRKIVSPMGTDIAGNRYFQALKRCKKLIAYEQKRLNYDG